MRKLFPYAVTALLAASSTNGMWPAIQQINLQKAPTEHPHLTSTCQELENPLNIIEQSYNYILSFFSNRIPTIEEVYQKLGIQEDFSNSLQSEKTQRSKKEIKESHKYFSDLFRDGIPTIDEINEMLGLKKHTSKCMQIEEARHYIDEIEEQMGHIIPLLKNDFDNNIMKVIILTKKYVLTIIKLESLDVVLPPEQLAYIRKKLDVFVYKNKENL